MNSTLLIKLLGGLTATAGVGTGGYFLKEHFAKSKEESKDSQQPKEQDVVEKPNAKSQSPQEPKQNTDSLQSNTIPPKTSEARSGVASDPGKGEQNVAEQTKTTNPAPAKDPKEGSSPGGEAGSPPSGTSQPDAASTGPKGESGVQNTDGGNT